MKARVINDLHSARGNLKILSNCTSLKARAILREFSNIPRSLNP